MKYLIIAALVIILFLYIVLIPLAKRKNMKDTQKRLQQFYEDLAIGDLIMLSDGIKGKITAKSDGTYKVQIAGKVEVEVNKFGIIDKWGIHR